MILTMEMDILLEHCGKNRRLGNIYWKQPVSYHTSAFGEQFWAINILGRYPWVSV